jgi:FG-GAP-like repeat
MLTTKDLICFRSLLVSSVLSLALAGSAFANHRTGSFPLTELVVAGDFNEDGNLDLAVNIAGFDIVAILNGDGQANFTLKEHVETDTLPKGLAVGDVNGDHRLDLISINQWGYDIRVNLGDGRGGFIGAGELNGDGEPVRIALGDLNNDGKLDLIANAPAEGKILIYFGDGHGGFSNTALELEDLDNDYTFAVGDLNKDGNADLVAVKSNETGGNNAVVFLGDGTGRFMITTEFAVNEQAASTLLADLNHDGNIDILIGGAGPENKSGLFLSSYLGDGTGQFTIRQVKQLGTGAMEGTIGLADFNEDGNLDVAFPITFSQEPKESTTVLIFLGDGTGAFRAGRVLTVGAEPHSALAADFNQDGHVDLAVTNREDATLSILLGDGSANFTTHATIPVADVPAP